MGPDLTNTPPTDFSKEDISLGATTKLAKDGFVINKLGEELKSLGDEIHSGCLKVVTDRIHNFQSKNTAPSLDVSYRGICDYAGTDYTLNPEKMHREVAEVFARLTGQQDLAEHYVDRLFSKIGPHFTGVTQPIISMYVTTRVPKDIYSDSDFQDLSSRRLGDAYKFGLHLDGLRIKENSNDFCLPAMDGTPSHNVLSVTPGRHFGTPMLPKTEVDLSNPSYKLFEMVLQEKRREFESRTSLRDPMNPLYFRTVVRDTLNDPRISKEMVALIKTSPNLIAPPPGHFSVMEGDVFHCNLHPVCESQGEINIRIVMVFDSLGSNHVQPEDFSRFRQRGVDRLFGYVPG